LNLYQTHFNIFLVGDRSDVTVEHFEIFQNQEKPSVLPSFFLTSSMNRSVDAQRVFGLDV